MTGARLDGTIVLGATIVPIGLTLQFADLVVDDDAVVGDLALTFASARGGSLAARIGANVDVRIAGGRTVAKLSALDVYADAAGVHANGALSVDGAMGRAAATFSDVRWERGKCHPVDGSLFFTDEDSSVNVEVTFLPTSHADGIVVVKNGKTSARRMPLLAPCRPRP
jgi:hypothetical protein